MKYKNIVFTGVLSLCFLSCIKREYNNSKITHQADKAGTYQDASFWSHENIENIIKYDANISKDDIFFKCGYPSNESMTAQTIQKMSDAIYNAAKESALAIGRPFLAPKPTILILKSSQSNAFASSLNYTIPFNINYIPIDNTISEEQKQKINQEWNEGAYC